MKVSAADPVTLKEAVIIGPLSATRSELQRLAVQKLEYIIAKDSK